MKSPNRTPGPRKRRRNLSVIRRIAPKAIRPQGKTGRPLILADTPEWTCATVSEEGQPCGHHQPKPFAVCPRCRNDGSTATLQNQPNTVKAIIINLAKSGLSQKFIATQILPGFVSEDTITREKQRDPAFAAAIDTGRPSAISFCMTKLLQNVAHGHEGAIEYFLTNSIDFGNLRLLGDPKAGGATTLKFTVDPSRIVAAALAKAVTEKKSATVKGKSDVKA